MPKLTTATITPILIGTLFLAGCGGGGGGAVTQDAPDVTGGVDGIVGGVDDSVTGREDVTDTLTNAGLDSLEDAADAFTAPSVDFEDLPISGTADYAGILALQLREEDDVLIGSTELEVLFDAVNGGTFTGRAGEFSGETTGAYTGELTIANGDIIEGSAAFLDAVEVALGDDFNVSSGQQLANGTDFAGVVGDLTGALTSGAGLTTTVDASVIGTFTGEDEAIVGLAPGTSQSSVGNGIVSGILVGINSAIAP